MRDLRSILRLFSALSVLFFFPAVGADAIYSYEGPDLSDFLRLTDFVVEGPAIPRVGDAIAVRFNLQNFGQFPVAFADKGVFAAVADPGGEDRSFGFMRNGSTIQPGETVAFSGNFQPSKEGCWSIWPSYQIWLTGGRKPGKALPAGTPALWRSGPLKAPTCPPPRSPPPPGSRPWDRTFW